MTIRPWRVALYAGIAGLAAALTLVVVAATRSNPVAAGENLEWLLSYLLLLGFPVSLVASLLRPLGSATVIRVAMVLSVAVNWGLLGYLVAKLLTLWKRSN
jgi:putative effector of murein hydrolase LrgA (UPF0299 family)